MIIYSTVHFLIFKCSVELFVYVMVTYDNSWIWPPLHNCVFLLSYVYHVGDPNQINK